MHAAKRKYPGQRLPLQRSNFIRVFAQFEEKSTIDRDKQNDLDDVNIFCGRDEISINKTQTYIKTRNILLDMLILPQPSHYTMPPHLPAHNSTHFINAITSNRLTSCILCHQFVSFDLVSS